MGSLSVENEVYLLPSSYGQNRIWFFEQMLPNSPTYHIPILLKITGDLQPAVLEKTIQKIIERHEVLRTTFLEVEGELKQKVSLHFPSFRLDVKTKEELEEEKPLTEHLKEFALEPFDLEKGPLIKFQLVQLSADQYYLLVNIHHIIFDAWSLEVLQKEIITIYTMVEQGREAECGELPLQYADYANWQKEMFEGETLQKKLNFWQQHLDNIPSLLELPTDRPRPKEITYAGDIVKFDLPLDVIEPITTFCRTHQATHYTFFLATFNVLLYRYTGQKDIVIGTPITNRPNQMIQDLIGFFVNTLPVRTFIRPYSSFLNILKTTIKSFLQTYENSEVPFEKLVQELKPDRDSSYHPIFQALFTLQDYQKKEVEVPFTMEYEKISTNTSKFDLVLYMSCSKQTMSGEIEYSTDLFNRKTMERFAQHYITLIREILKNPDKPIYKLNILTEEEKNHVIENNVILAEMGTDLIHHLVDKQALKHASKIAVKGHDHSFTYEELYKKSNQIAHELIRRDIQPGSIVGIRLKRSPDQIACILGVLKSGCVYMPIDPSLPVERVEMMVEDSKAAVIITDDLSFNEWKEKTILEPDVVFNNQTAKDAVELSLPPEEAVAYVIYTSGTTGKPKGVSVTHAALINHVQGFIQEFQIGEGEMFLQNISSSFDPSMSEIFCSLVSGGTLVITHPDKQFDIDYLADVIAHEAITVTHLFHSLIEKLLDLPSFRQNKTLKYIFTGGEALPNQLVRKFYENMKGEVAFVNLYGPTEACVAATYWRCHPEQQYPTAPIGIPFPNYHLVVLDENLQAVPQGVVGELFIGGHSVAKGYENNPELTAEAFPLLDVAGVTRRYYRTGDLVKQLDTGDYLFISRKDTQVKVRGFRIELDEIRHVLQQQPEIEEAAVLVEEVKGDKKIFAFAVKEPGVEISANELKKRLAKKLPYYMVPHVIRWLTELPVSINGKLDKKRLSFDVSDLASGEKIPPRNQIEQQLADIWREVLAIDDIGINEDFFDLGGHSIKVIEIVGLTRKRMNIQLSPSQLFLYRTIETLSEFIQSDQSQAGSGLILKLKEGRSGDPPLFLVHPGGGGAICYVPLARNIARDINIYGIQSLGYEKNVEPLQDIREMAKLYVHEVQKIQPKGPYQLAGWSFGGTIAVEMARIFESKGEKVSFLGLLDAYPFDQVAKKKHRLDPLSVWADSLSIEIEQFSSKPKLEKCQIILEAAKQKKLLPRTAELEDVFRIITVMAANNMASDHYTFSAPIKTDLHAFTCQEVDPRKLHELVDVDKWRGRTTGKVYTYPIMGHHNNLMSSPQVEYLGQKISETLKRG